MLGTVITNPRAIARLAHPVGDYQIWHSLDLPQEIGTWPGTEWALLNGTLLPRANYPELEALVVSGGTRLAVLNGDDIELIDYTGRVPQAVGRAGAIGAELNPGERLGDRQRRITGSASAAANRRTWTTVNSGALTIGGGDTGTAAPGDGTGDGSRALVFDSALVTPTGPTNEPNVVTAYMIMRVK